MVVLNPLDTKEKSRKRLRSVRVLPEAAMNKDSRTRRAWWRLLFALPVHAPAAAEDGPSISTMLKEGWQIAGYSQASDNRSTFILFRHPDQAYLVQCRAGYDATRTPPTYSICYRLK